MFFVFKQKFLSLMIVSAFAGALFLIEVPQVNAGTNEVIAQLGAYVNPTNGFNVANLSVGSEASLTLGDGDSTDLVWRIIRVMGQVAGTFAILLYIAAGFFIITAAGEEERFNKGKTIAELTTIGLVFIFSAYIIVQFTLALIFAV